MKYWVERDMMGEVQIPIDVYYGAQTQRSIEQFKIAGDVSRMPKEIIKAFGYLKKAAAITNYEEGILSKEKCELISNVCDEIIEGKLDRHFPLVVWQPGSGALTNANVNEVIANRGHVLHGGKLTDNEKFLSPNDDVNKSQSSYDTFPTAMHIAAYKMLLETTIPGVETLLATLELKSQQYKDVIKVGRNHFMDAMPITVGQECSICVAQLNHGLKTIRNSLPNLTELALGGSSVETVINAPENFDINVAAHIAKLTGYPFIPAYNKYKLLASHEAIFEAHSALKTVAVSLMKIANDISMLMPGVHSDISELFISKNETAITENTDPTQSEALKMIAAQVMGNDVAITIAATTGNFELNLFKPLIICNFLHSARLIGEGCCSFNDKCAVGLKPIQENIKKHLDNSLMLVTALNPKIGYFKAAEIAQTANREGKTLKEKAVELGYLSSDEFDQWTVPLNMS